MYTTLMPQTPTSDKDDRVTLSLRIPRALHERIAQAANADYRSINLQIQKCLEQCHPAPSSASKPDAK